MLSLNSIAIENEIASHIESPRAIDDADVLRVSVHVENFDGVMRILPGCDFTELRVYRLDSGGVITREWVGSFVTIQRPGLRYGNQLRFSSLNWSSSSSEDDVTAALVTAKLLDVAARVAHQLDRWAGHGELERLAVEVQS